MLLNEFEGKGLLGSAGIVVPDGVLVHTPEELNTLNLGYPIALKVQVSSGGRGKLGGVRRCGDLAEARRAAGELGALRFGDETGGTLLAEPWLAIERELYLSVVVDGAASGYSVIYSPTGGMDVESAGKLTRYPVGLARNFRAHELRRLLDGVEPDRKVREAVIALARRMLTLAEASECLLIEVNPLAVLEGGRLVAADAKVSLDEAAAFRHAYTQQQVDKARGRETEEIRKALEANLMLVWLDGDIGLISGGAGMTMAAMDQIDRAGAKAACFLDCSGNPTPAGIGIAIELLDRNPTVKGILVSMFGGGLQTDRVARSLIGLLRRHPCDKPLSFRLNGTGSKAATAILADAGYLNHENLDAAVREIVSKVAKSS